MTILLSSETILSTVIGESFTSKLNHVSVFNSAPLTTYESDLIIIAVSFSPLSSSHPYNVIAPVDLSNTITEDVIIPSVVDLSGNTEVVICMISSVSSITIGSVPNLSTIVSPFSSVIIRSGGISNSVYSVSINTPLPPCS